MKLEKCANGHYFDKEVFDECPYCNAIAEEADEMNALAAAFGSLGKIKKYAKGSVATVYTITPETPDGPAPSPKYALKVIRGSGDRRDKVTFRKEVHMLVLLRGCEHIVQIVFKSESRERFCILEEYAEPFSKKWRRTGLTYRELLRLGSDICQAVIECMDHNIMHLDIQPKNILVDGNGTFKLCDFSSSQWLSDVQAGITDNAHRHGTLAYIAPEAYLKGRYSEQSEIYSLGILLYSLLNGGKLPFTETYDLETAMDRRVHGYPFPAPDCPVPGLAELVMRCCANLVQNRYENIKQLRQDLDDILQNLPENLAEEMALRPEAQGETGESGGSGGSGVFPGGYQEQKGVLFDAEDAANSVLMTAGSRGSDGPFPGSEQAAGSEPKSFILNDPDTARISSSGAGYNVSAQEGDDWRSERMREWRRLAGGSSFSSGEHDERETSAASPGSYTFEEGDTLPVTQDYTDSSSSAAHSDGSGAAHSYGVNISEVEFSAVAPRKLIKGETSIIDLVMYEEAYRKVVDQIIRDAEEEVQEKKSGVLEVAKGSRIRIELSSPDLDLEDNVEEGIWRGKYLEFNLAVYVPEDFRKRQILLTASVYTDGVPLTKLRFTVKTFSLFEQKLKMIREDVLSGFVSYASQDRERVASRVQGMLKARPDMNLFFDVDSLRSGDDWERILRAEIDRRDVLFLFWSRAAKESEWVAREWKYALNTKGPEVIEPVPMDPPDQCPPPEELRGKHFNDRFLFMTHGN